MQTKFQIKYDFSKYSAENDITLSNASSPHNKGTFSLKTDSAGAYSWGLSLVPDLSTQELDTQSF